MRILFMGHNKWACLTLRELIKNGHDICGVITETDEYDSNNREHYNSFARFNAYESLKNLALGFNLPLYQPDKVNSAPWVEKIEKMAPELIVIVSYHAIIKGELLEKYGGRIINAHAAYLPYYKGRAPITWAIINGEEYGGVTVHFIDKGVDTGPIIVQQKVKIVKDDRGIDLLLRMLPLFPKLVSQAVRLIETKKVKPRVQNPYEGCYFAQRDPINGAIDWQGETSQEIHNKVRALTTPYPKAFFIYGQRRKVFVLKTTLPDDHNAKKICPKPGMVYCKAPNGGVKVTTTDGYIIIDEIEIDGKQYPGDYLTLGNNINYNFIEKQLIESGDWPE
jgi:methionyl-tRNA formyltransferase